MAVSYSEVIQKKIDRIRKKLAGYEKLKEQLTELEALQDRAKELDDLMNKVAPVQRRGPRGKKGAKKK